MNIDIDVLKTFIEVHRTKHFGKAADNLFVTQSTVSARIKLLENALGTPLFLRNRNDIQLTPTGKKFLKYAESMIVMWNRARHEIAVPDESKSTLVVAGIPSLWDIVLQDWINRIYANESDLVMHLEVLGIESISRKLQEGSIDLAFAYDTPSIPNIEAVEVLNVQLMMVSDKQLPNVEDALRYNYVLVDWGSSFATTHASHFQGTVSPVLHSTLGRLAKEFILNTGGTCYLAEAMVQQELKKKTLFKVPDAPVIRRNAYALYPINSDKSEQVKLALDYVFKASN